MSTLARLSGPLLAPQLSVSPTDTTPKEALDTHEPRLRKDFDKLKIRPQSWFAKASTKNDITARGPTLTSPVAESSAQAVQRSSSRKVKVHSVDDNLVHRLSFQAGRPKAHWFLGKQVVSDALEDYISRLVADAAFMHDRNALLRGENTQLKARLDAEAHKLKSTDDDLVFYRTFHDRHQSNYERLADVLKSAKRTAREFNGQARQGLNLIAQFNHPVGVHFASDAASDSGSDAGDEAGSSRGTFGPESPCRAGAYPRRLGAITR